MVWSFVRDWLNKECEARMCPHWIPRMWPPLCNSRQAGIPLFRVCCVGWESDWFQGCSQLFDCIMVFCMVSVYQVWWWIASPQRYVHTNPCFHPTLYEALQRQLLVARLGYGDRHAERLNEEAIVRCWKDCILSLRASSWIWVQDTIIVVVSLIVILVSHLSRYSAKKYDLLSRMVISKWW